MKCFLGSFFAVEVQKFIVDRHLGCFVVVLRRLMLTKVPQKCSRFCGRPDEWDSISPLSRQGLYRASVVSEPECADSQGLEDGLSPVFFFTPTVAKRNTVKLLASGFAGNLHQVVVKERAVCVNTEKPIDLLVESVGQIAPIHRKGDLVDGYLR